MSDQAKSHEINKSFAHNELNLPGSKKWRGHGGMKRHVTGRCDSDSQSQFPPFQGSKTKTEQNTLEEHETENDIKISKER